MISLIGAATSLTGVGGNCVRQYDGNMKNIDWLAGEKRALRCHRLCLVVVFHVVIE